MELTVLGAQGTWPGAGGENCGYLISDDGYHLWVDAGTGTFARLQQVIPVDQVGAMLITHGHPDHFVDIIPTFYARHYGGLGEPGLPLWSPGGFTDIAAALVAENGRNVMAEAYAFRTAAAGDVFEVGPFRVTPFEMEHIGVRSLGYRIETGGAVLAYTGDTGMCDAAVELARDADLFLCEATYQDASRLFPFHLSASQAGRLATAAGSGHVVLTHLTPELDHRVSIREAARTFDGPIDIAVPGMILEVGR
ncbi:MAG TPA: MBL fold metallo-hydrolase [Actinomycetota bacterium]|nr:MBL fold metallo-hydrolase [Actinomycetota bacterium]